MFGSPHNLRRHQLGVGAPTHTQSSAGASDILRSGRRRACGSRLRARRRLRHHPIVRQRRTCRRSPARPSRLELRERCAPAPPALGTTCTRTPQPSAPPGVRLCRPPSRRRARPRRIRTTDRRGLSGASSPTSVESLFQSSEGGSLKNTNDHRTSFVSCAFVRLPQFKSSQFREQVLDTSVLNLESSRSHHSYHLDPRAAHCRRASTGVAADYDLDLPTLASLLHRIVEKVDSVLFQVLAVVVVAHHGLRVLVPGHHLHLPVRQALIERACDRGAP